MKVIGYEWKLRQVMAAAGMFSTTKLIPELEARGIHLSASQVYRPFAVRGEWPCCGGYSRHGFRGAGQ